MLFGKSIVLCACAAWVATTFAATTPNNRPLSSCTFAGTGTTAGSCGSLFGQTPKMTLRRAGLVVGGIWRSGASPTVVWYGDMTDEGYPNAPIQLQIYSGRFRHIANDLWMVPRDKLSNYPVGIRV